MSYLPCENPNCNSYGKPHPNCRCHGDMAKGGEAHFCSTSRSHDRGCQFFADGGAAIDPASVVVDSPTESDPKSVVGDQPEIDPASVVVDQSKEIDPASVVADGNQPEATAEVPAEAQQQESPYESTGQMAAAFGEGAGQGLAGPLAPLGEKAAGVPETDIAGRAEANPGLHALGEVAGFGLGMATGVGEAKVVAKAAELAGKVAHVGEGVLKLEKLRKIGEGVVNGLVQSKLITASDDISKSILGQAPPTKAVTSLMSLGAPELFAGVVGGLGAGASIALKESGRATLAGKEALAGFGHAAQGGSLPGPASEAFRKGYKAYEKIPDMIANKAIKQGGTGAAAWAALHGDIAAGAEMLIGSRIVAPVVDKITRAAGKYTVPTMVRWLTNGMQTSPFDMMNYAAKVAKGESRLNNTLDALFKSGATVLPKAVPEGSFGKFKAYFDEGGYQKSVQDEIENQAQVPKFAEGGHVTNHATVPLHDRHHGHIAQVFPEQHAMLQAAKGRVSDYLTAAKPQKPVDALAFDDTHDDREQTRRYTRALNVAIDPTSVLGHVKDGTLEPEHVEHLQGMYPELADEMRDRATKKILEAKLKGEKPNYRVRQGLSLLMGVPLESDMTPQGIQAAQQVFAAQNASKGQSPQGGDAKPKKSTSGLTKSDKSYLTDAQSRVSRGQRTS